jgi:DnaJ like chaperone protein
MPWKAISQAVGWEKGGGLRAALAALWARLGPDRSGACTPAHRTVAFTIAVTTLAAKMAKADGVALAVEAEAFERLFQIPRGEETNLRRLYHLATRDVAGYEVYAGKIARMLKDEPELLRSVLECLFHIAAADGVLHPAEDTFLETVAQTFGLGRMEYLTIRASFVHDPESPYAILGVPPDIPDAELKVRHRALVREHHPDQLAAAGVPPEFRCAADRRLAAINAAYDAILKERAGAQDATEQDCEERCP